MVKNPPAMRETWGQSLGWEDTLEEVLATHSSILVWRIPTDRGAWWATVHGVAKSRTRPSDQAHTVTSRLMSVKKYLIIGLPWWLSSEEYICQCRRHRFDPWCRKIPHASEELSPCGPTIEHVL